MKTTDKTIQMKGNAICDSCCPVCSTCRTNGIKFTFSGVVPCPGGYNSGGWPDNVNLNRTWTLAFEEDYGTVCGYEYLSNQWQIGVLVKKSDCRVYQLYALGRFTWGMYYFASGNILKTWGDGEALNEIALCDNGYYGTYAGTGGKVSWVAV